MNNSFIDKYSDRKSIIHSLDPRVKFIFTILFILFIITSRDNDYIRFIIYFSIILIIILLSKIPLNYIFLRSLVIIPFALIISIFNIFFRENGLNIFYNIVIKSFLSILSLILLSSTTNFTNLLKGFEKMHFPYIFIQMLSFMYRYIFVIMDEMMRLKVARDSRYFGGRFFNQIKVFGNIIGLLFIRSYERGERIYNSMLSRGFDGSINTMNDLRLTSKDFIFSILFLIFFTGIGIWRIILL